MHVLTISWEYPPYVVGGMGKHVAELIPALSSSNEYQEPLYMDVVTQRTNGAPALEELDPYTRVHRIDLPEVYPIDLVNSVVDANRQLIYYGDKLLSQQQYDIIHTHDWLVAEAGITLKLRHRVPLVTTIHATERGRYRGHLPNADNAHIDHMEWRACYEAWEVIVCSRHMAREVNQFFRVPIGKIDVIPNGVNLNQIHQHSPEARLACRERLAPNGERLLFFVGRMVYEKGLPVLLKAMPGILARYPDTRLVVAGKNPHQMAELAQQYGVVDRVDFLGFVSDSERDLLYQSVDAAIFPSLYEPFGIVALEAMANDCNVIVSEEGGLGEVIHHEINGLTVLPNDHRSIVWAVDRLFSDMEAGKQRRLRARREVETLYNWKLVAQKTTALYARVAAARKVVDW
ncbi:MAG: glycosyltransferase family 4 protein [Caldilineaceae bacterium]|nr:glycosyltransferase family 4 protein [Caldilineaceae bacterium]